MSAVLHDNEGRLLLELRRTKNEVTVIPFAMRGLAVVRMPLQGVSRFQKRVSGTPAQRVAALFVGYAADLGATDEAVEELEKLTPVSTAQHLAIQDRMETQARGESDDASRIGVRSRKR